MTLMPREQIVKEFNEIIGRVSTVEQLAIWYVIDGLQTDSGVPAITPDVSKAGLLLAHLRMTREYYDDGTPEIITMQFKDRLESQIVTALRQKPERALDLLWTTPSRHVIAFPVPPIFFLSLSGKDEE